MDLPHRTELLAGHVLVGLSQAQAMASAAPGLALGVVFCVSENLESLGTVKGESFLTQLSTFQNWPRQDELVEGPR